MDSIVGLVCSRKVNILFLIVSSWSLKLTPSLSLWDIMGSGTSRRMILCGAWILDMKSSACSMLAGNPSIRKPGAEVIFAMDRDKRSTTSSCVCFHTIFLQYFVMFVTHIWSKLAAGESLVEPHPPLCTRHHLGPGIILTWDDNITLSWPQEIPSGKVSVAVFTGDHLALCSLPSSRTS